MTVTQQEEMDLLASALVEAKQAEASAKKVRIEIEEKIISLIGAPEEGQQTMASERFKVTTKGGMSRKADFEAMRELDGIDADLLPIRIKEELNLEALRNLQSDNPSVYNQIAGTITTKPLKVSVQVKEVA